MASFKAISNPLGSPVASPPAANSPSAAHTIEALRRASYQRWLPPLQSLPPFRGDASGMPVILSKPWSTEPDAIRVHKILTDELYEQLWDKLNAGFTGDYWENIPEAILVDDKGEKFKVCGGRIATKSYRSTVDKHGNKVLFYNRVADSKFCVDCFEWKRIELTSRSTNAVLLYSFPTESRGADWTPLPKMSNMHRLLEKEWQTQEFSLQSFKTHLMNVAPGVNVGFFADRWYAANKNDWCKQSNMAAKAIHFIAMGKNAATLESGKKSKVEFGVG